MAERFCVGVVEGSAGAVLSAGKSGGEGGIRTHEGLAPLHAFQACLIGHSSTSPGDGPRPPAGFRGAAGGLRLAERVGFEPTRHIAAPTDFRDRLLRPLGHLSTDHSTPMPPMRLTQGLRGFSVEIYRKQREAACDRFARRRHHHRIARRA